MKLGVRAVIIRDNMLLVMKRNKFGDTYYTLIGGGVDPGETPNKAVVREVDEETSLKISEYRKVFVEPAWGGFAEQHIYLCQDPGGEVLLQTDAIETDLNKLGNNTYEPMWLDFEQLAYVKFRSTKLQKKLLESFKNNFPSEPVNI